MKKSIKRITCLLLSAIAAFPLVSCTKEQSYDPETTPVVFATETLDGNFNPFFATSGGDSEMTSMTQIGMLTTDDKGNIAFGEDEPTVTLDFDIVEAADQSSTTYKFIIKNGIQFSDGEALTIKDVLFNLYVYLDPAYMGSATMYSTDIKGLKKYRAQDPEMTEDDDSENLDETFYAQALTRKTDIIDYLEGTTSVKPANYDNDIALIKQRFKEELESDWTMCAGTQESYKDEYTFTEDWQIFYFNEGIVKRYMVQGAPQKDTVTGKYITNLDVAAGDYYNSEIAQTITDAANDSEEIKKYTDLGNDAEVAKQLVIKETAIQTVYDANVDWGNDALASVLKYWATGVNILDDFAADARLDWYNEHKADDGSLAVKNISGIKTSKTSVDFSGKALGAEHDVLTIEINGIDPKAKYNFAFAVAPLHYYSGTYNNVNYITAAQNGDNFGVAFGDKNFFETVLQNPEKNKKPVGAGAYQVSNSKGDETNVNGNDFYINNWVYFVRNKNFNTVGSGLNNANIKYLRYKVVNTENIVQALKAGDIHVGEPNATTSNIDALSEISYISATTVRTNGYGYVGINPKYVPDIEVRKAIMMALDAVHCKTYYGSNASVIHRPMSLESWVWDFVEETDPQRDRYYAVATNKTAIQQVVESGDSKWVLKDGKYVNSDTNKPLKLTFTIAGATTDHPAYTMFDKAKDLLNSAGFDITVTTDVSALKKLATGQLEVWAAAWSSTVDPDMYQVYHKDSTATSVNNWGYPTILNDSTGQFTYEKSIINLLSEQIELGRTTNDQETRAGYYKTALDYVMKLAVEFPTYQRDDCVAYNNQIIDPTSLNQNPTAFAGVIDRIWELKFL